MWEITRPTGTVVVGCDTSWESQTAVVAATREAARRRAELVLLAVVERLPYWPDNLAWVARVEAESTLKAKAAADRAAARSAATDPTVIRRTVIVSEVDSTVLDDVVRRAGLLVLGRRGDGGQSAFSMGSTSAELARRFRCPLLVVGDQGKPRDSRLIGPHSAVVVGLDLSRDGDAPLLVAVTEAAVRHLPLVVVHAVPRGRDADRAAIGEGWRRCREALRNVEVPAGVPNRLVITRDDPVPALLNRVGRTDLLVVGTHGQGRLAGLVAGSVSRQILDRMTCDVMVVQPWRTAAAAKPYALAGQFGP